MSVFYFWTQFLPLSSGFAFSPITAFVPLLYLMFIRGGGLELLGGFTGRIRYPSLHVRLSACNIYFLLKPAKVSQYLREG